VDSSELIALLDEAEKTNLTVLLHAREQAKAAVLENSSAQNLASLECVNRMVDKFKADQAADKISPGGAGDILSTQALACEFLRERGYKIGKSKFNADFKRGLIPTAPVGGFDVSALLGYAAVYCKPTAKVEDDAISKAAAQRLKADADQKSVNAARAQFKFEQELGKYILKEDHERELGARAAFFRRELENLCRRLAGPIITLARGDENRHQALIEYLLTQVEETMDAWAGQRSFVLEDNEETKGFRDL
jgi:hypothetical protein